MAIALLVAAGRGERLGHAVPKALVPLAGQPMLAWSIAALQATSGVREIVIALPAEALGAAPAGVRAVAGAAARSGSVREALRAASPGGSGSANPGEAVIVHDAARPLATPALFERAVDELVQTGADGIVAAIPVADTVKAVAGDGLRVARTLPRDRLWAVQTPQVFRRDVLEAALEAADDDLLARATDDAWLVEQQGGDVRLLPSSPRNLKVTTPLDLRVAELLLGEGPAA